MSYKTIMAHLEMGHSNSGLLKIARDLSQQLHARVIGVSACQPLPLAYGDVCLMGDVVQRASDELDAELKAAEAEFRSLFPAGPEGHEWRSSVTYGSLCDYVVGEARSADLVITNIARTVLLDETRCIHTGGLVLSIGRPVLLVPPDADTLALNSILIAWKETRESRRAALDALPLLKRAAQVCVVEIAGHDGQAEARRHVEDVVSWLRVHHIAASSRVATVSGEASEQLGSIAEEQKADLIVAGAYGHSRLREWVLGGVTGDLLLKAGRFCLVSH